MIEFATRKMVRSRADRRVADFVRMAVLSAVALAVTLFAQPQAPAIAITSPAEGSFVSGPVTVQIQLKPEPTEPVRVALYADGRLVCALQRPPWQCSWNAGEAVAKHE